MADSYKAEKKAQKKAYKKARGKASRPWKFLTWLTGPIAVILIAATVIVGMFDNTIAIMAKGTFTELINEDPNAVYYEMDFASNDEMGAYGIELCRQVEAEGAALLMNNGALPLAAGAKVSTLSSSSVDLVYGGTGSGNVDASKADDLKASLEKSGLVVNPTLWDFYKTGAGAAYNRSSAAGESAVLAGQASIAEVPVDKYSKAVKDSFAEYGDAVIVTLSRVGGEGYDLEFQKYNYLALSQEEKDMLSFAKQMKADGTVKSIVVLLNTSNALQVDFLKNNDYDVDAVLWVGGLGISGTNAVTDILAGKVNPSGSLADVYCYDNFSSPAMQNFIATKYAGDLSLIPSSAQSYMIYQEGIYVGYKYYETRYEDFVMGTGNAGTYDYSADVAFPFGYGLSYSSFAYDNMAVSYDAAADQYKITLTVTNNGDMAGKETVQIYAQSPYTQYDKDNGVEKAAVQLCGFTKTGVLQPGASETVTVSVDKRDLAAYDTYGAGTYILDAGDYYFTAATDSHNAVNNILAAKGFTPATTNGRMDAEGNAALTYKWVQASFDDKTYSTSLNGTQITNQLSSADINLYEGVEESITYLTRNDWAGTWPTKTLQLTLTEMLIGDLQDVLYDPADYPEMEMPTMGADNGITLYDMIGLDYNDPKWEQLLDQLTFEEMVSGIGDSFHWRMPIESVNAPGTRDENGPQGLTMSLFGGSSDVPTTAFTSEDVMAATFNTELMYAVGNLIGNNCLAADVACLYGPGANTHRTPYGGRNFEYYSEDGFLAGEMGGAEVKGIQDKGVDVVMKHFALNDCEQDRLGQAAWVGEQAAREIYLKAYQKALEESGGNGVMTAYTRWGAIWSGSHKGLMTGIMRNEWGNQTMSITDNVLVNYCNGVDAILAGGVSTFDAMLPFVTNQLPKFENDPVIVNAMRNAMHHNLYALANSSGMNGIGKDTVVKAVELKLVGQLRIAAIVVSALFVISLVLWILTRQKFKKGEVYAQYQQFKKSRKKAAK
ncbi:MAG: glycoside hydrolase family 3 C-terminal domain-containing protein [Oscillospiraceae bacterium]|nr:glycoside hydrolase family 3 C-terminal domain-containing protein [Oscillospiraceae bacterium]